MAALAKRHGRAYYFDGLCALYWVYSSCGVGD